MSTENTLKLLVRFLRLQLLVFQKAWRLIFHFFNVIAKLTRPYIFMNYARIMELINVIIRIKVNLFFTSKLKSPYIDILRNKI